MGEKEMTDLADPFDAYRCGYEHVRVGIPVRKPITGYETVDEVEYHDGRLYAERCASTGLVLPEWPATSRQSPRACWAAFKVWARADNQRRSVEVDFLAELPQLQDAAGN